MVSSRRVAASVVLAAGVVLGAAACSPSPSLVVTPTPKAGPAKTATFSGSLRGSIVMDLCGPGDDDTILVSVSGTKGATPGVVSKTSMSFNGPGSVYSIDMSGPQPRFSSDGKLVDLAGVRLESALNPSKAITLTGSIACP